MWLNQTSRTHLISVFCSMTEDVQGLVGPNGAGEPSQLWGGALSPSCPSDPDKGSWFNQPAQLRSGVISLKDKGR